MVYITVVHFRGALYFAWPGKNMLSIFVNRKYNTRTHTHTYSCSLFVNVLKFSIARIATEIAIRKENTIRAYQSLACSLHKDGTTKMWRVKRTCVPILLTRSFAQHIWTVNTVQCSVQSKETKRRGEEEGKRERANKKNESFRRLFAICWWCLLLYKYVCSSRFALLLIHR